MTHVFVNIIGCQLAELIHRFSPHKTIVVDLDTENPDLSSYGEIITAEGSRITLRVPKADTASVTARILSDLPVVDLTVEDWSITWTRTCRKPGVFKVCTRTWTGRRIADKSYSGPKVVSGEWRLIHNRKSTFRFR